MYPKLVINLTKIKNNACKLAEECHKYGITMTAVTKVFCADERIVNTILEAPIDMLADSRLENIAKYPKTDKKRLLLRAPMPEDADSVVCGCDISLNSELITIKCLAEAAEKRGIKHSVILMVDLGDLREGIFYKDVERIEKTVEFMTSSEGIDFLGVGVNLTCYGSIIPTAEKLQVLCDIAKALEVKYDIEIPVISGGNSSSLYLLYDGKMPEGVNNLRIGEGLVRGEETAYQQSIPGVFRDAIVLQAGLIEVQRKPSYPEGEIGLNAFGEKPFFEDKGERIRGIVKLGRQDVPYNAILCTDPGVEILGASSDHLIVDLTDSEINYEVGSVLEFKLEYSSVLAAFTSEYVQREYIQ